MKDQRPFVEQLLDRPWRSIDRNQSTFIQAQHPKDLDTWCDLAEIDTYLNSNIAKLIVIERNLMREEAVRR